MFSTPEFRFGLTLGMACGALVALASIKFGEMWALMRIDAQLLERRREQHDRPSALPDYRDADVRTLDAMDHYLDRLDREQTARKLRENAH